MNTEQISQLREEVGRKGAETRWAGREGRATACLRVYPEDLAAIKARAKAAARLPADVVAEMVRHG